MCQFKLTCLTMHCHDLFQLLVSHKTIGKISYNNINTASMTDRVAMN